MAGESAGDGYGKLPAGPELLVSLLIGRSAGDIVPPA